MATRDGTRTMQALAFMRERERTAGRLPTLREIDRHMGWGCGAWDALRRLGQWGYVEELGTRPRVSYRLTTEDEWRSHVAELEHDLPPAALTGFAK